MIFILLLLFLSLSASAQTYDDNMKVLRKNVSALNLVKNFDNLNEYLIKIQETINLLNVLWRFLESYNSFDKLVVKKKDFFNYYLKYCKQDLKNINHTLSFKDFTVNIYESKGSDVNQVSFYIKEDGKSFLSLSLVFNECICKEIFSSAGQKYFDNNFMNLYNDTITFLKFWKIFDLYNVKVTSLPSVVATSYFLNAFLSCTIVFARCLYFYPPHESFNINVNFSDINKNSIFLRDIRSSLFISFDDQEKQKDYNFLSSVSAKYPVKILLDSADLLGDNFAKKYPALSKTCGRLYNNIRQKILQDSSTFHDFFKIINVPIEKYLKDNPEINENDINNLKKDIHAFMNCFYDNYIQDNVRKIKVKEAKNLRNKKLAKYAVSGLGLTTIGLIAYLVLTKHNRFSSNTFKK